MAEENIENQEQENEEKVQHSIGEVMQLLSKLSSINLNYSVASKALHSKQKKLAKEQARKQAKSDAITVCEKYKLGKEAEAKAIQEITERYDEEVEKITTEFEQKEEAIRAEHEKNDDGLEELVVKEAEARKAYKQAKKTKEYKDFVAKNAKLEKEIKRYEDMKDSSANPEAIEKIIAGLKELAPQNPLNRHAEELKTIEARKKEIINANKELETKLDELETKFEEMWDQLDVNKNKALVDVKNKDLIKPTLGQRLSNFFTSQAKRRENAKIEAKKKREERIEAIKKFGGIVGNGIVSGVKKVGGAIKDWHEANKQKRRERINVLYAKLTESYQTKEEKLNNLEEEKEKFNQGKIDQDQVDQEPINQDQVVPVPKGEDPIIESDDKDTKIEIVTEEKEKSETEKKGSEKPTGKETKAPESKVEVDHDDR